MEIDPTTYEGHLVPIEAEWRANGRDVVVDFLKEYSFIALQGQSHRNLSISSMSSDVIGNTLKY